MFTSGETVGLAEWIIDDTCLVTRYFSCWDIGILRVAIMGKENPIQSQGCQITILLVFVLHHC